MQLRDKEYINIQSRIMITMLAALVSINTSTKIQEDLSKEEPSSANVKLALNSCDRLMMTLRALSSDIIELRVPSGDALRDVRRLIKEHPYMPEHLRTYSICDKQFDNISWHAHMGILTVKTFHEFREPLTNFNQQSYAELLWLHGDLIAVASMLRRTGMNLITNFINNTKYVIHTEKTFQLYKP